MICGADMLWYARAVLEDPQAQESKVILAACRIVEDQSDDAAEVRAAQDLRRDLDRNADEPPCFRSARFPK